MFNKTFCSSPWFHVRLTYDGSYETCRWATQPVRQHSIQEQSLLKYYNSEQMKSLRSQLLAGEAPQHCSTCYYEESFGKLNGRLRQLKKSAVDIDNFDLTVRSSPHYKHFEHSLHNRGLSTHRPTDLQIDLGNTCNSACIMCGPEASSRLEKDYQKLNKIDSKLFANPKSYTAWTRDPALVDRLIQDLVAIPDLRYIHFLGGETLYEESFYTICDRLIEHGLAKHIIVGITTNGTIYNNRIQKFINEFKEFHLGISIESVTTLNDYIRWPSQIDNVLANIDQFLNLRSSNPGLYISLRITPNVFSVYEIDRLFKYMIDNQVIAESCNILQHPGHLRMELIPDDIRIEVQNKLKSLIDHYKLDKSNVINIRRSDQIDQVIANVILDYYQFMCDYTVPENAAYARQNLVQFLKAFEQLRGNSILDHVPQYEKFLRHYGY